MGIPKYRQWLQERFPSAFTTAQSLFADHVVRWSPLPCSPTAPYCMLAPLLRTGQHAVPLCPEHPVHFPPSAALTCWRHPCVQYLDANSVMHEVGRRANTPEHFLQLLCGKLDQLFSLVRPTQSVCLCVVSSSTSNPATTFCVCVVGRF